MKKGGEKEKFCDAIKGSLKEAATVEGLRLKSTLEIQDIDALSSAIVVQEALCSVTGYVCDVNRNDLLLRFQQMAPTKF